MLDTDPPLTRSQSFSCLPSTFPYRPSYNDAPNMKIQQEPFQDSMDAVTGQTKSALTPSYSRGTSMHHDNHGLINRRRSIPRQWTNERVTQTDMESSAAGSSNFRCGAWDIMERRSNTQRDVESDDDENDGWLQSPPFRNRHPQKRVRLNPSKSISRTSPSKSSTSSTLIVHPLKSFPTSITQVRDV